jgi:hypothetical protein
MFTLGVAQVPSSSSRALAAFSGIVSTNTTALPAGISYVCVVVCCPKMSFITADISM